MLCSSTNPLSHSCPTVNTPAPTNVLAAAPSKLEAIIRFDANATRSPATSPVSTGNAASSMTNIISESGTAYPPSSADSATELAELTVYGLEFTELSKRCRFYL